MDFNRLIFMAVALCFWAAPVWSEPGAGETAASAGEKQEVQHPSLAGLRELDEGAHFLLLRYATLEALVGALQAGRIENQAFAIGTASVIPGAGQMINGDYRQGGLLLLAGSLAGLNANQLAFSRRKPRHPEWALATYSAEALRDGVMLYATLHAANASFRAHQNRTAALWTGTASVVPGVGQAINRNWWEAAGFFGAWAMSAALATDMENRFYAEPEKTQPPVADQKISWSVALLPAGILLNASW